MNAIQELYLNSGLVKKVQIYEQYYESYLKLRDGLWVGLCPWNRRLIYDNENMEDFPSVSEAKEIVENLNTIKELSSIFHEDYNFFPILDFGAIWTKDCGEYPEFFMTVPFIGQPFSVHMKMHRYIAFVRRD